MHRKVVFMVLGILYSLTAMGGAVVEGMIMNGSTKEIKIDVFQKHLDAHKTTYSGTVEAGYFKIDDIELDAPRIIYLTYARQTVEIYLAPNEQIFIETEVTEFPQVIKFVGRNAFDNECWRAFKGRFREELNPFNQILFRKGLVTYEVENTVNARMIELNRSAFEAEIGENKLKKSDFVEGYKRTGKLSDGFIRFIQAEIEYDWAYKMLVYGYAYGAKHELTPDFWAFTNTILKQNENTEKTHKIALNQTAGDETHPFLADFYEDKHSLMALNSTTQIQTVEDKAPIGNEKYQRFLMGYVNYIHSNEKKEGVSPFVAQYYLANRLLNGLSLDFFHTALLTQALKSNSYELIGTEFADFTKNAYLPYRQILAGVFQKTNKYMVGAPAPNFQLIDSEGKAVSLSDFRGKVVYLNFWATWCAPCLQKIAKMKSLENQMYGQQDIVFIHISFDKDVAAWQSFVKVNHFTGVQLFAPSGINSTVATLYDVKSLPESFIIDKSGNFAPKPLTSDTRELEATLQELTTLKY